MSHCASISLRLVSGLSGGLYRVDERIAVSMGRVGGCAVSADRVGGMNAAFSRVGGNLLCRMGIVCGTGIGGRILWAQDGKILNVNGKKIYVTAR